MEIVREAADGVSTSVLAKRFGVTPRAVQYTLKSDDQRQRDTAVPVLAVSVKVTPDEMAAFDAVLASGDVDSIVRNTREITSDLRGVSGDVSAASQSLQETLASVDSTISAVGRITARIEQGEGSLGRLIFDPTIAASIEQFLLGLNLLLDDLRENPRKYVRLSIF